MKFIMKSRFFLLFFLAVSLTACASVEFWPVAPTDQSQYATINVAKELQKIASSDQHAIDYWQRTGLPNKLKDIQTTTPVDVGLHFAGYPNIDETQPDKVLIFYNSGSDVTLMVLSLNVADDSIADFEERVDLKLKNSQWSVDWAGYRQRCRRSTNKEWTTGLCP